jgi:hypothetical protein
MSNFTIKFREVQVEVGKLLEEAGFKGLYKLEDGGHNVLTNMGTLILTVGQRSTPIEITLNSLKGEYTIEQFTDRYLRPAVAALVGNGGRPYGIDESFAHAPKNLAEVRSEKAEDGSLRSVRDMLVEVLRAIDSGDPNWQDLKVGILVVRRRLETEDHDTCSWRCAGPGYDAISALGLLSYASTTLVND